MISEHLQLELQQHLQEHPWLSNMGLSPYTTLCCGLVIRWLEEDIPEQPDERRALHLIQPAGERILPWLALAITAWATRKAHLEISGFEKYNRGDLIRISKDNIRINARFITADRDGRLTFSVRASLRGLGEESETTVRIDPRLVEPFPRGNLSTGNNLHRLLQSLREGPSPLDGFLHSERPTFGHAALPERRHLSLMGVTKSGIMEVMEHAKFLDQKISDLLEVEKTLDLPKEGFSGLAAAMNAWNELHNELSRRVLVPLRNHGIIDDEVGSPLEPAMEWFNDLHRSLSESIDNSGLRPDQKLDFKQRLTDLKARIPQNEPSPTAAAAILCKGIKEVVEPGDAFDRLVKGGARVVFVSSVTGVIDTLRNVDPGDELARKAALVQPRQICWADLPIQDQELSDFPDDDVVRHLSRPRLNIRFIRLEHGYPTANLVRVRAKLWEVLNENLHNDDIRHVATARLDPVLRFLLYTPGRIDEETHAWIEGNLTDTEQEWLAIDALHNLPEVRQLLEEVCDCVRATVGAINALPAQQHKGYFVPPKAHLLTIGFDGDAHHDHRMVPLVAMNSPEYPRHVAVTGRLAKHFGYWLERMMDDPLVERITIIDEPTELDKWAWLVRRRQYLDRRAGSWDERFDGLVPPDLTDSPVQVDDQARAGGGVPDIQDLEEELDRERRALRPRVRGTDDVGGDGHMVASGMLEFADGRYMAYPTAGYKAFPVLEGRSQEAFITMKNLGDLMPGDRLIWIPNLLAGLREDVRSSLKRPVRNALDSWRIALEQLLAHYGNHVQQLSNALNTSKQNVLRWLHDKDLYAPNEPFRSNILQLAHEHGLLNDEEPGRLAKRIDNAKRLGMKQRGELEDLLEQHLQDRIDSEQTRGEFEFRNVRYTYQILNVMSNDRREEQLPGHLLYHVEG
jgi:hypothetical protein